MKFSFWTQKWNYSDTVKSNAGKILEDLIEYYNTSSNTFNLINKSPDNLKFSRGRKWISAFGLGSEKWCYHIIEIDLKENDGFIEIFWDIDLKIFGFQVANNALIEECREIIRKEGLG